MKLEEGMIFFGMLSIPHDLCYLFLVCCCCTTGVVVVVWEVVRVSKTRQKVKFFVFLWT